MDEGASPIPRNSAPRLLHSWDGALKPESSMETTKARMEKKREAIGITGNILGVHWDNGKRRWKLQGLCRGYIGLFFLVSVATFPVCRESFAFRV